MQCNISYFNSRTDLDLTPVSFPHQQQKTGAKRKPASAYRSGAS